MKNSNEYKVKKAVIPAAGLGTRFLPATKSIPKELLPIVDRPILLYIIEECLNANINEIVLISGRNKEAIEDFFDVSFELEWALEKSGRIDLLSDLKAIRDQVCLMSIRQKKALGLGHAVLTAQPAIGNDPFAVLLGDEIVFTEKNTPSAIAQLKTQFESLGASVASIMEVTQENVSKYGIIDGELQKKDLWKVNGVIEKPSSSEAPSRMALTGRYVFDAEIFKFIENCPPGKNGEIQLADAMNHLAQKSSLFAMPFDGRRFDAGDKLGYLKANVEVALKHPELAEEFKAYLIETLKGKI
jgi:UTP--glucose-1-phosphate uridylyltransferase